MLSRSQLMAMVEGAARAAKVLLDFLVDEGCYGDDVGEMTLPEAAKEVVRIAKVREEMIDELLDDDDDDPPMISIEESYYSRLAGAMDKVYECLRGQGVKDVDELGWPEAILKMGSLAESWQDNAVAAILLLSVR